MSKERITISISKELLKQIDGKIDGIKIRNRSHSIESLLTEALGLNLITDAIIMAGGDEANKYINAIEDALVRLKNIAIKEVIIAVGYKGETIKKRLGNGDKFGIAINYFDKGEGSGGVLKELKKALKKTFLVINLEDKLNLNYKMLIEFHKNTSGLATVATDNIKTLKGIYVFEPEIVENLPNGFSMLEEDIFPKLLKEESLTIYPVIE
jgi:NDP-sugar pyrophosphorylase family protein